MAHATGLRGRPLFERAAALVGAAKKNSASVQPVNGHEQRMRQVKAILADCVDAKGTLVETYLQARGVDLPPGCTDLLYHPNLTDWDARRGRPAMVAIIRDATGQVTGGIHRTYLADDGSAKADTSKAKMMLGPSAGVVQLMPIGEDGVLGVGEGIETSLAGAKIFGVPAWAALSAGNMRNFKFPKGLKQLIIFADRGEDGEKSAAFLLSRAKTASIDACIYLPNGGDDFADDLACSECRAEDYVPFWPDDQRPDSATDEASLAADGEIIPPTLSLDELIAAAQRLTRDNDVKSNKETTHLIHELALAELDPATNEQILQIVKHRTGLAIGPLRQALQVARREVGAKSRAVSLPRNGIRQLNIGSDVEIAQRVADELQKKFDEIVFDDGEFWRYTGTHWEALDHQATRCAVHQYDGAYYQTPACKEVAVQLGKARIDSVLHEMAAKLAQPDFFAAAPAGINCASGFIRFAADGRPGLMPHDGAHRCRHVLPGRWQPGVLDAENPPPHSLLGRLLDGVFKGDADGQDKRKLLAEVAGAAAVGYGPKLRQPKAIVLAGEEAENGKSQILDALRGLLPPSATASLSANKFADERFIVGLRGKLLNAIDELSSSAIASDTFKAVITGEPVSGRDVYRSAVSFRPVAQHVFATNRLPKFTGGMDRGVQRRLLPVMFNRVIPEAERVENIGLRIAEEEPDLLVAFAVAGAERLIRQRNFAIPASSRTALQQWIFRDDPVLAWVQARVDPASPPIPGVRPIMGMKSSYAYSLFRDWAVEAGFLGRNLPDVSGFVQRLKENKLLKGITVKHTKSGNWLVGLEIRPQDRSPADDGMEEMNPLGGIDVNGTARVKDG